MRGTLLHKAMLIMLTLYLQDGLFPVYPASKEYMSPVLVVLNNS